MSASATVLAAACLPTATEFSFDADDVGAIIAYLKSIQQPAPKK